MASVYISQPATTLFTDLGVYQLRLECRGEVRQGWCDFGEAFATASRPLCSDPAHGRDKGRGSKSLNVHMHDTRLVSSGICS